MGTCVAVFGIIGLVAAALMIGGNLLFALYDHFAVCRKIEKHLERLEQKLAPGDKQP